jgi:hypothetical protein
MSSIIKLPDQIRPPQGVDDTAPVEVEIKDKGIALIVLYWLGNGYWTEEIASPQWMRALPMDWSLSHLPPGWWQDLEAAS